VPESARNFPSTPRVLRPPRRPVSARACRAPSRSVIVAPTLISYLRIALRHPAPPRPFRRAGSPIFSGLWLSVAAAAAVALAPSPAVATEGPGLELGVRTGYAFSAGRIGAPANGTDRDLGDFVSAQVPLWLDVGYRINGALYLGGYFQYGFGVVNDDRQGVCRNDNVDCSASDIRLGVMGRYALGSLGQATPWVGLGFGYEWTKFSVHESVLGTDTDATSSGFEIANLQLGLDFPLTSRLLVAPFLSVSFGQYQSSSTKTVAGALTTNVDQDYDDKSVHEWVLIGARFAFSP